MCSYRLARYLASVTGETQEAGRMPAMEPGNRDDLPGGGMMRPSRAVTAEANAQRAGRIEDKAGRSRLAQAQRLSEHQVIYQA